MEDTLASISTIAQKASVSFIVVAGDVYDSRSITHEERNLFSSWLGSLSIPALIISGNHDKRGVEVGDTSLSYLTALEDTRHILYDGVPTIKEFEGCYMGLLPYQGWTHQEFSLILEALTTSKVLTKNLPLVVVLHEAVRGCRTDVGHEVVKTNQIRLRRKAFPQVTYWALGDIHKMQPILPNAWYSGAPHQTTFGETLPKGVLIVNTKDPTHPKFEALEGGTPLVTLTEVPTTFPDHSYVQLKPTRPLVGKVDLPANVVLHPSAHLSPVALTNSGKSRNTFAGLTKLLQEHNLSPKLQKLAWVLTKRIGNTLGILVKLPKKFRV